MIKQELIDKLKQINQDIMNIPIYDILHIIEKENITYDKTGDIELYDILSKIKHSLKHNKLLLNDIDKHLYGIYSKDITQGKEILATLYIINYYLCEIFTEVISPRLYNIQDIKEIENAIKNNNDITRLIQKHINEWKEYWGVNDDTSYTKEKKDCIGYQ